MEYLKGTVQKRSETGGDPHRHPPVQDRPAAPQTRQTHTAGQHPGGAGERTNTQRTASHACSKHSLPVLSLCISLCSTLSAISLSLLPVFSPARQRKTSVQLECSLQAAREALHLCEGQLAQARQETETVVNHLGDWQLHKDE